MARYRSVGEKKVLERAVASSNNDGSSTTIRLPDAFKDVQFFKPEKDVYMLNVIGYVITSQNHPEGIEPGYLWHSRRYFRHSNIGVDDNSYVCLAKTFGKRCPICEYAKQGKNNGTLDKDQLAALRPKERILLCVIDTADKEEKIQLWDTSQFVFGKLLDRETTDADDPSVSLFFEPDSGYSLRVRFSKESFNGREFWKPERIDFKSRKNDYDDSIVEEVPPLDDILIELTYDQLEEIFVMGSSSDKEEDEAPRSRRSRARTQSEEDVDEAPASRSRRAAKSKPEDDEVDEPAPRSRRSRTTEPEEEVDETPPPRRSARGSRAVEPEEEPDDAPPSRRGGRASRATEPEEVDDAPPARNSRRAKQPEPEEEVDDVPPPRSRGARAAGKEVDADNKCPEGLVFGNDCDKYDACDSCGMYSPCNAAKRKRG